MTQHILYPANAPDDTNLTTVQSAAYLNLSKKTLEAWRTNRREHIPFIRAGGRVLYRLGDLRAWLEQKRVAI